MQTVLIILFAVSPLIAPLQKIWITVPPVKSIINTVCTEYKVPYVSISPLNRYCPEHGYIADKVNKCPICGAKLKMYQRITGYLRAIDNYNDGKAAEFYDRVQLEPEND